MINAWFFSSQILYVLWFFILSLPNRKHEKGSKTLKWHCSRNTSYLHIKKKQFHAFDRFGGIKRIQFFTIIYVFCFLELVRASHTYVYRIWWHRTKRKKKLSFFLIYVKEDTRSFVCLCRQIWLNKYLHTALTFADGKTFLLIQIGFFPSVEKYLEQILWKILQRKCIQSLSPSLSLLLSFSLSASTTKDNKFLRICNAQV